MQVKCNYGKIYGVVSSLDLHEESMAGSFYALRVEVTMFEGKVYKVPVRYPCYVTRAFLRATLAQIGITKAPESNCACFRPDLEVVLELPNLPWTGFGPRSMLG